jgi:hypothetical protein
VVGYTFFVFAAKHEFYGGLNEFAQCQGRSDLDLSTRNFAIVIVFVNLSGTLNSMEQAGPRIVVAEYIKWIFTEVKTAVARLGFAFVLVGFALFELESTALHVPIESLESVDNRRSLFFSKSTFSILHQFTPAFILAAMLLSNSTGFLHNLSNS